jgi:hypothetical protein
MNEVLMLMVIFKDPTPVSGLVDTGSARMFISILQLGY